MKKEKFNFREAYERMDVIKNRLAEIAQGLENDKERLERDALSIVMGDGEKISSYQDSAQRERLEELQAQYQALEEQYGATDSEEMQRKIGAKMGALLAEAQIIAANEYNAS